MDLHELEPGVWYLHIIDHFTRFSAGNTENEELLHSFTLGLVSMVPPQRIYGDNGGKFNNNRDQRHG